MQLHFIFSSAELQTKEADRYQRSAEILFAQKKCEQKGKKFLLAPKSGALSTENYAESHKQTNFFSMHKLWLEIMLDEKLSEDKSREEEAPFLPELSLKKIIFPLLISSSTWKKINIQKM